MPLLEIVVGERTGDEALARAFDLGRRIGKTPIVVNDGRGFFTSRVIGRFIDEAIGMLAEGVPAAVDRAGRAAGRLPDRAARAGRRGQHHADPADPPAVRGGRRRVRPAAGARAGRRDGRRARPAGACGRARLLRVRRRHAAAGLWPGLAELATDAGRAVPFADLQERMLFAEALDARRCLDEGVLRTEADANVGSILGIGFPAWTGGVLRYVRQYAAARPTSRPAPPSWPTATATGSRPADLVDRLPPVPPNGRRRVTAARVGRSPGCGSSSWPASPRRRSAAWCSPTSAPTWCRSTGRALRGGAGRADRRAVAARPAHGHRSTSSPRPGWRACCAWPPGPTCWSRATGRASPSGSASARTLPGRSTPGWCTRG